MQIDSRQMTSTPRSSPDGKGLAPVFTGNGEGKTSTAFDIIPHFIKRDFPRSEQKIPAGLPNLITRIDTRERYRNGLYHNEDDLKFAVSMCGQIY